MTIRFYGPGDFERLVAIPVPSSPEPYRTDFRRDYARVVHSPVFRRLQRKTQLFPGDESDFFRNRLTHSLEVAQIAKSIAIRLNYSIRRTYGPDSEGIDLDLVEVAGLAHDLGHPPFGHTGEHALHARMHKSGGFEGNAQTLRILAKLEKRQTLSTNSRGPDFVEFATGRDLRAGLNLCFRSLASILKYDNCIPVLGQNELCKGYYSSEADLVTRMKQAVLGGNLATMEGREFKVLEMQIMDLADDIAYSTYDFEDALKAGFASRLDLLQQLNNNNELIIAVARKLFKTRFGRDYPIVRVLEEEKTKVAKEDKDSFENIRRDMLVAVFEMLRSFFGEIDAPVTQEERELFSSDVQDDRIRIMASLAVKMQKVSDQIVKNGYVRSQLTSDLIGKRLRTVEIKVDEVIPALSKITIPDSTRFEIDVLKHLTYELHIKSPRLKLIEYRGNQIVSELFDCFDQDRAGELFPDDWRGRLQTGSSSADVMNLRHHCSYRTRNPKRTAAALRGSALVVSRLPESNSENTRKALHLAGADYQQFGTSRPLTSGQTI